MMTPHAAVPAQIVQRLALTLKHTTTTHVNVVALTQSNALVDSSLIQIPANVHAQNQGHSAPALKDLMKWLATAPAQIDHQDVRILRYSTTTLANAVVLK